ncbi:MFS transporter [Azotobacter armeniacus]
MNIKKNRLPYRTYLYFTAQSINLITAVMSVTMAAIVGASLSPTASLSTLPYGFQFLFVMLATYPASRIMSAIGRRAGFLIGSIPLAVAGVLGFMAIEQSSFLLLTLSHAALGSYIAFANFNRFAATDGLDPSLKPKAISLVVAGGVIAALLGPALAEGLRVIDGFHEFAFCYASFVPMAILSAFISALMLEGKGAPEPSDTSKPRKARLSETLKNPIILLAIVVASVGYCLMNLLMIQASMYMKGMHTHFSDVSTAIQWHVIAMFAPSFFTGVLITRLGLKTVIYGGIVFMLLSSVVNLSSHTYEAMTLALIILGLGWNFTYVGGGALLARGLEDHPNSMQIQGVNDLGISILATLGAFAPALLLSSIGWSGSNMLCIGICAVVLLGSSVVLQGKPRKRMNLESAGQ